MIHQRGKNDTLSPINAILMRDGGPIDLAGLTVKFQLETDPGTGPGTSVIAETATGVTAHPTQAFTTTDYATNNWLLKNEHGVKEGQQVVLSNSGGALPSGLTASIRYFAVQVQRNTFRVSQSEGGVPVTIAGAGTGTHSFYVVGSVQYTLQAALATARMYRAWFTVYSGLLFDTVPTDNDRITVEATE